MRPPIRSLGVRSTRCVEEYGAQRRKHAGDNVSKSANEWPLPCRGRGQWFKACPRGLFSIVKDLHGQDHGFKRVRNASYGGGWALDHDGLAP